MERAYVVLPIFRTMEQWKGNGQFLDVLKLLAFKQKWKDDAVRWLKSSHRLSFQSHAILWPAFESMHLRGVPQIFPTVCVPSLFILFGQRGWCGCQLSFLPVMTPPYMILATSRCVTTVCTISTEMTGYRLEWLWSPCHVFINLLTVLSLLCYLSHPCYYPHVLEFPCMLVATYVFIVTILSFPTRYYLCCAGFVRLLVLKDTNISSYDPQWLWLPRHDFPYLFIVHCQMCPLAA